MIRYEKFSASERRRPGRSGLISRSAISSVSTDSSPSRRNSGLNPISSGSPGERHRQRLLRLADVLRLRRDRHLTLREPEPERRVPLRHHRRAPHDLEELLAGQRDLVLEGLGNQLLVVRELPVDPPRRQPDVSGAEHDVVLLDADPELGGVLRDPRELGQRAGRDDRLELGACGLLELRRLDRHPVRVGRSHDEVRALEVDEHSGQHGARLVTRRCAGDLRDGVEEGGAVDGEGLRSLDFGQLREVLGAVRVQLVRGRPAGDLEHTLLRAMLEHHFAVRQQPREVDQQPPGRDDRALALDLRLDREAQRELHVGGGQLAADPSPPRRRTPPSTWTLARVETARPTTASARVSSSLGQVTFTADPTAVSISVI